MEQLGKLGSREPLHTADAWFDHAYGEMYAIGRTIPRRRLKLGPQGFNSPEWTSSDAQSSNMTSDWLSTVQSR